MAIYGDPAAFPPNDPPSGTWSSCNVVSGSFVKFSAPLEGDDVSDIIVECRNELPFSDQLPAFDPPDHTAHRHLLTRLITPKRLKENEDFMWQFADRLIDGFVDEGSCEMVGAYAEPFTLTVIADLEGVPESDHSLFREHLSTAHQEITHKPLEFLYGRFSEYIEDRRRDPRSDVLTGLATATFPDGSTPDVKDAALIAANLFAGGQETTVRLLSFALRMLAERPDLQVLVRDDRAGSQTSLRRPCGWRARCAPSSAWRVRLPRSPAWTFRRAGRSCSCPVPATVIHACSRTRTRSTSRG